MQFRYLSEKFKNILLNLSRSCIPVIVMAVVLIRSVPNTVLGLHFCTSVDSSTLEQLVALYLIPQPSVSAGETSALDSTIVQQ